MSSLSKTSPLDFLTPESGAFFQRSRTRSYMLGLAIVVALIVVGLGVSLAVVKPEPAPGRAAERLPEVKTLPEFRLVDQTGREVRLDDLRRHVCLVSFIFTRCRLSCPRITTVMKDLGEKLAGTNVRLVSISVDPTHDTPEVLAAYAHSFEIDPEQWWLLTGETDAVMTLVREGFGVSAVPVPPEELNEDMEEIAHSDRIALVDRGGRLIGFYDSTEEDRMAALVGEAKLRGSWIGRMPAINASLNFTASVLLALAWAAILTRRVTLHAILMSVALVVSAVFLGCYLTYHFNLEGVSKPYDGVGPIRYVYYTILISHVALAILMLPVLALTVARVLRRRFAQHARIAAVTFPIWAYVSVTGVIVYIMLYS